MKNIILAFALNILSLQAFGQAAPGAIFQGPNILQLKPNIIMKDSSVKIMTGDTDNPTSVAKDAVQGSLYIRSGTGALYQKQDNGSSTNWIPLLVGPAGSGTDECVARWNGTGVPLLQDSVVCITDAGVMSGLTGTQSIASLTPANPGGGQTDNQHSYQVNITPSNDATNLNQVVANYRMDYSGPNDINELDVLNLSTVTNNGGDVQNVRLINGSVELGDGTNGGTTNSSEIFNGFIVANDGHTVSNNLNGLTIGVGSDATATVNNATGASFNMVMTGPVTTGFTGLNLGMSSDDLVGYLSFINAGGDIDGGVTGAINGVNISPNVTDTIGNYNGFYTNPSINAAAGAFSGVFVGGAGTGVIDNYIGVQVNPAIASGGDFITGLSASISSDSAVSTKGADIQVNGDSVDSWGLNINMNGSATTSVAGVNVNVGSATVTAGGTARPISIAANGGTLQVNSNYTIPNSGGFDAGNSFVMLGNIASGTPVTADFVAQAMPFVFTFEDDFTTGPLGIGAANVGYVSQVAGTPGSTVDNYSLAMAAMGVGASSTGGDITNLHGYRSGGALNFGGSLDSITNLYHFRAQAGTISPTNVWGISVDDATAENYFDKSVIIGGGGTKKVSNADVGLEIASLKAFKLPSLTTAEKNALNALESMFLYDETLGAPAYYDGSSWITLGSGLSGLTPNSGLRVDGSGNLETVTQTNGQLLIGSTGAPPQVAALTGTANQISVTNGAGSITLSTPQDIGTSSSVTFGQVNVDNLRLDGNTLSSTSGDVVIDPTANLNLPDATASRPLKTDASRNVISGLIDLASTNDITGVLDEVNGGTGQSTYATGDLLYGSAANTLSKLAAGTNGHVLTLSGGLPVWAAAAANLPRAVTFSHVENTSTNGGSATGGTYDVITLNTETGDGSFSSLASNEVTLDAGTYLAIGYSSAYQVNSHVAGLFNATDATFVLPGSVEIANAGVLVMTKSVIYGVFTIGSGKALQLVHRVQTARATDGFGVVAGFAPDNESVYAAITFIPVQ